MCEELYSMRKNMEFRKLNAEQLCKIVDDKYDDVILFTMEKVNASYKKLH